MSMRVVLSAGAECHPIPALVPNVAGLFQRPMGTRIKNSPREIKGKTIFLPQAWSSFSSEQHCLDPGKSTLGLNISFGLRRSFSVPPQRT